MVLQELLFPNYDTCATYDMYFRLDGKSTAEVDAPMDTLRDENIFYDQLFLRRADIHYDNSMRRRAYYDPDERALHLAEWQRAGFDTYFNYFSIWKWVKYTRLDNLKLRLELKGGFQVSLLHMYTMYTEPFENCFCERICRATERTAFEFEIPAEVWERGIVSFRLQALEGEDNVFYGGGYMTEVDESTLNPVDIAIDICTYRRERFVTRNVALLNKGIIHNPDSPVYGHLDVYISDNGHTLDAAALSSERVHVYPNKNVGGAGGFARGMMEILDTAKQRHISHVLVMDDDVLIHTDAIVRTYRLLQFMKPEYAGKTVAGAMLRLDNRHIQHECGGHWAGFHVVSHKGYLDLKDVNKILLNETEDTLNYNAWWYSCIPISKINDNNLPLPIFYRYDDVEYGLRTGGDIIAMGGICLWHEPFEYKRSPATHYYEFRNQLIVNAIYCPEFNAKNVIKVLRYALKVNMGRYLYNECNLAFRAVEDFCKGPEFLITTDGEALHKEIMAAGEKLMPLDQLSVPFDERNYLVHQKKEPKGKKFVRFITLNRMLLPRSGTSVVDVAANGVKDFAGKKQVLCYDVGSNRGFVSEYSAKKTIASIRKYFRTVRLVKEKYAQACEAYRQAMPTLTSRAFWEGYLGLKED